LLLYPTSLHRNFPSFPTRRSSDLFLVARLLGFEQRLGLRQRLLGRNPAFARSAAGRVGLAVGGFGRAGCSLLCSLLCGGSHSGLDRKSTRLNSSHVKISYAVFCLK